MMTTNSPWNNLNADDALRINASGKFDFFWVKPEKGTPGLMLRFNQKTTPLHRLPKLKNLSASFRNAGAGYAFVLTLKELSQIDVFETLCRNVVDAGETAENIDDALSRTIQRTYRWHHLLRGGRPTGLSTEEQRGLVGELAYLRKLAANIGPDMAIEGWTGPSGAARDFEFINTCIEVKTKRVAAKPYVSISSAEQLADINDCRIFLNVQNVASAVTSDGLTLHDHVALTAKHFQSSSNAFDKWEESLYSTGYDPANDYEERRWHLFTDETYEVKDGFPRITTPLLPGVEMVRYSIALDACRAFITDIDPTSLILESNAND
ncbi:MAG: PD-(D/E)XK motif protein [Gammaproteobacteria bacterium]|nr:PD-(D/E)XK motif protein [Gammaproteobacteria bacterium]MBU2056594.1 PD-(D/E)XK motif protein [Gammaproteobacteria bacterium]MBU2173611.1 PD-(D/E)XK motif protein [Gammaproteobacteria bacterium]MBU2247392.1 PD-(D/E)XK motif protein [Gammaproteobacteria bacterium]MBU2428395.1 PD-(D/E)XK motif protein [Gammaproteobacteria bacterium]